MPFYENRDVQVHYEEAGSGFPLLVIAGGGLNSTIAGRVMYQAMCAGRRPRCKYWIRSESLPTVRWVQTGVIRPLADASRPNAP